MVTDVMGERMVRLVFVDFDSKWVVEVGDMRSPRVERESSTNTTTTMHDSL
jgi:hypothetical protein